MRKDAIEYPEGEGGREVCTRTAKGRREYRSRTEAMWERQRGLCAICGHPLRLAEAIFDHEHGRGMGGGHRDDRIEVGGRPQNAAVHWLCNSIKASKRTEYLIQPQVVNGRGLEEMVVE